MGRVSARQRALARTRLLRTAAEHFALHGYDGASINRISLAAGYAKGTVYGYFDSKAALFCAVLELGSEATLALFRRMDLPHEIRAQLRGLAHADVTLVRQHEAFAKVLLQEYVLGREETRPLVDQGLAPLLEEVTALLRSARDRGEIASKISLEVWARLFCAQLSMLYVEHWRTGVPSWEELPELLVSLFMDGAGAPPDET